MIWSPSNQFERIRERSAIWWPLTIIIIIYIIDILISVFSTNVAFGGITVGELGAFTGFAVGIGIAFGV